MSSSMKTEQVLSWLRTHSRNIWLLLLLMSAWLLWSGIFKPLVLFLGAASCVLTLYVIHRINKLDDNKVFVTFNVSFLGYWLWLTKEVIKSSLQVTRIVLDPRLPISPRFFEIEAKDLMQADQVLLGNSITLTPGTLTMDLHEGVMLIHSLTEDGAEDLMSGEMHNRVKRLRKDD